MRAALAAGLGVVACVSVLLTDYVVASRRAPRDERLIKSLQQQVRSDASRAPRLEAEHKRITAAKLARKSRDNVVAWGLIAAAALFLVYAKRVARQSGPRMAPQPSRQDRTRTGRTWRSGAGVAARPTATTVDVGFVDEMVAQQGRGKEAAIPLLEAIQAHYRYLPDEALRRLCELTEITPAQIAGTSSFYAQFRRSPTGKHIVRVCHGTACHVAGARQVTDELRRYLAIAEGADTDPERMFTVDEVACLGCCSLAPVLMVDSQTAGRLTPSSACGAVKSFEQQDTA